LPIRYFDDIEPWDSLTALENFDQTAFSGRLQSSFVVFGCSYQQNSPTADALAEMELQHQARGLGANERPRQDLSVLQAIPGHRSITMTNRYAHMITDHLHRAVAKLDESSRTKVGADIMVSAQKNDGTRK
jgi:hypothetical protein